MVWDFAEANPFSTSSGNFLGQVSWVADVVANSPQVDATTGQFDARQADASTRAYDGRVVSTDPPYYDNIVYSDLSDFFYVWLRRSLHNVYPDLFATLLTPKAEELVANPYRRGGTEQAEHFFVSGFNRVFARIRRGARADVPITVYYAYKQQDTKGDQTASTGWETLLDGLIHTGWEVTATWPMRSERQGRMSSIGTNALASSIVLACRPRDAHAPAVSRREFLAALRAELPRALRHLIHGSIAPVDLQQAAIGPGISVFSRYARVREPDGTDMTVRAALAIINEQLDAVLHEQQSAFDRLTRFAATWYRQYGWARDSAGMADQLARSNDTSIGELARSGIFEAVAGKARLIPPLELARSEPDWNPDADALVSIWEATVRLAGLLAARGVERTGPLMNGVAARVGLARVRELAFLLFHEAEAKGDGADAGLFNGLVTSWDSLSDSARTAQRDRASRRRTGTQASFGLEAEE